MSRRFLPAPASGGSPRHLHRPFSRGAGCGRRFQVDAHILDDGFQHLALARNVDVAGARCDATLSDWHLLPAGRQREPLLGPCGAPRSWCSRGRIPPIRNTWKNWY
jgi:hypothetical protein